MNNKDQLAELNLKIAELDEKLAALPATATYTEYGALYNERNNLVRKKLKLVNSASKTETKRKSQYKNKKRLSENLNSFSDIDISDQPDTEFLKFVLVQYGVATESEIQLVCDILPEEASTLEAILFARTGYTNFTEFLEQNDNLHN